MNYLIQLNNNDNINQKLSFNARKFQDSKYCKNAVKRFLKMLNYPILVLFRFVYFTNFLFGF